MDEPFTPAEGQAREREPRLCRELRGDGECGGDVRGLGVPQLTMAVNVARRDTAAAGAVVLPAACVTRRAANRSRTRVTGAGSVST